MMRMSLSVGRRALTISGLLSKVIPVEVMNFRSENVLGSSLTRRPVVNVHLVNDSPLGRVDMRVQESISDEECSPGTCAIIFIRGNLDVPQDTLVSEGRVGMVCFGWWRTIIPYGRKI